VPGNRGLALQGLAELLLGSASANTPSQTTTIKLAGMFSDGHLPLQLLMVVGLVLVPPVLVLLLVWCCLPACLVPLLLQHLTRALIRLLHSSAGQA
jgi:hypothetical protein